MTDRLSLHETLAALPPEPDTDVLAGIQAAIAERVRTIVVLDDDPTGTQTVYDVPVLTNWEVDDLKAEFERQTPLFYILTNSRSMPHATAVALNKQIAANLREAAGRAFTIISRSDSTLRGHYPAETDALTQTVGEHFENCLIIPAFFEGGRYTINDVHYVADGDTLMPAAHTEFARDASFGYTKSNLREWVAEKTSGNIQAENVASISLATIRTGGAEAVRDALLALQPQQVCVINAASYRDLECATLGIIHAEAAGKNFLFRTAASFVRTYAGLAERALLSDIALKESGGGVIVVGSYVGKTSKQLDALVEQGGVSKLEVDAEALLDDAQQASTIEQTVASVNDCLSRGENVVIYTSRTLITGDDGKHSLSIGQRISESVVRIVEGISVRPRFIIAKGGITSSDVATKGLKVRRAIVRGQILPGIPVWELGEETHFPGVPYVVFPGNVGSDDALAQIVTRLQEAT